MDFTTPDILECPHCGGLRRISCLSSGNDIGCTFWSDFKYDLPSLPSVSPVLKCPVCKKYHFYHRSQIIGDCKSYGNSDFGELSYESLKEALVQLKPQGKDEETLRMMLLWAYNDLYGQMHNVEILPDELQRERQFFRENALALFRLKPNDYMLHAELFREMGEFENCLAALDGIEDKNQTDFVAAIINKAKQRDANVFIIESDESSELRYPKEDSVGYIYSSATDWNWEYVQERIQKTIRAIKCKYGWYEDDEYDDY